MNQLSFYLSYDIIFIQFTLNKYDLIIIYSFEQKNCNNWTNLWLFYHCLHLRSHTQLFLQCSTAATESAVLKAGLKCLNEAVASIVAVTVWKSKQCMNVLGQYLFKERLTSFKTTRSMLSGKIQQAVPGYPTLATNIMAKVWNDIPDLQNATSLNAAKSVSKKWAKSIPHWLII